MSVFRELRNWIDDVASKFDEGRKEHKEVILAAKKKVLSFCNSCLQFFVCCIIHAVKCDLEQEKLLKQKAKDETAKVMLSARGGSPLSLADFDALLSQLKSESEKVQAEVRASLELVPKSMLLINCYFLF